MEEQAVSGAAALAAAPTVPSEAHALAEEPQGDVPIAEATEPEEERTASGATAPAAALTVPSEALASAEEPRGDVPMVEATEREEEPAATHAAAKVEEEEEEEGMQVSSATETCAICCDEVLAQGAVRLACRHGWYCRNCVQRHTETRLDVGAAEVGCPECSVAVAEHDLRKLLPAELIERLLQRSLERAVSAAADLWACPTPSCPMRVALPARARTYRLKCTLCKKESCLKCGAQPFHKGLTCEKYADQQCDAGAEDALREWMRETGTQQCPTCRMAVTKQKLEGQTKQHSECHKMICRNCGTRFCFKCLAVLTDVYTCGCSIDLHGFIDPETGKRVGHLKRRGGGGRGGRGRGRGAAAPASRGRGRQKA